MRKVAVLGYGTVGSGVVKVLEQSEDQIRRKLGEEVQVAKILDIRDFPGDPIQSWRLWEDCILPMSMFHSR